MRTLSRRAFLGGHPTRQTTRVVSSGITDTGAKSCTGRGAAYGVAYGIPALDFSNGQGIFCGECAKACPEPVFEAALPRKPAQVAAISDQCFAKLGIACGTCRDACPEQAILLRPRSGGLFVPEIDESACTGCGACIATCPATAIDVTAPAMEQAHA